MYTALGELPDEPAIDRAKFERACLCARAIRVVLIEQEFELCCRKIGIKQKPGARGDLRFKPVGFERLAAFRCASILPDNGPAERCACFGIPKNGGFTLIGDAEGYGARICLGEHLRNHPF